MLRPIKYLVITLAGMAIIASLSVVQAKNQSKAKLVSLNAATQTQTNSPAADATNTNPAASQNKGASNSAVTAPSAAPTIAAAPSTPTPSAPAKAAAPKPASNSTASDTQTGGQRATQPNSTKSLSGQTINMSSQTSFNSSSLAQVNAAAQNDTSCVSGGFETQFACLINNYRASLGLHTLVIDSALNSVAQSYASQMNATGDFSHVSSTGATFLDRCKAAGTTCWAENLAYGFTSPQTLFEMWKASPGHNANMINPGYRSLGLGESGSYAALYLR